MNARGLLLNLLSVYSGLAQEVLSKATALDADEIQKQMEEQHTEFLAFVKENYRAIFN
jgi:hypothetical protein